VIRLAEAQAPHAPVHLYRFDRPSTAFGGRLGAAHATELPFVWDRLDLPMSKLLLGEDVALGQPLATAIHAAWAQFVRAGDPNVTDGSLPAWPRYDATRRATLLLDDESQIVDDPGGDTRSLWSAL
jgi:para-nitrobenzyl esterase